MKPFHYTQCAAWKKAGSRCSSPATADGKCPRHHGAPAGPPSEAQADAERRRAQAAITAAEKPVEADDGDLISRLLEGRL